MNIEEILRDVIHDIVSEVVKDIPDDAMKDIHEMALLSARIHDRITKAKAISLEDVRRFNVLCYQRFDKIQDGEEFTKEEPAPEEPSADAGWEGIEFRFDFGEAIRLMKKGHRVARDGWNGKDQFIFLGQNFTFDGHDGFKNVFEHRMFVGHPAIIFKGTQTTQVGWLASQADMLADDWHVVEDKKNE